MAKSPRYSVKFRRRREGRTTYAKRIKLLQAKLPRLIIRKSNKYIRVQLCDYAQKGDKVLVQANSSELKKLGWQHSAKNIPAAYLAGLLCGKKAKQAKVAKAILDMGTYPAVKGSKIFAALKGAVDAGLDVTHDIAVFPSAERLAGKHIQNKNIQKDFEEVAARIKDSRSSGQSPHEKKIMM